MKVTLFSWCLANLAVDGIWASSEEESCSSDLTEDASLLNLRALPGTVATQKESCLAMKNHGSHFTVSIGIGTPAQKFDVVADTGSSLLVIVDCACLELGTCDPDGKCFQGQPNSSTFALERDHEHAPVKRRITYGSGAVGGVMASDTVQVGQLGVNVTDGLLLIAETALHVGPNMHFEGILGLGLPIPNRPPTMPGMNGLKKVVIGRKGPADMKKVLRRLLKKFKTHLQKPVHGHTLAQPHTRAEKLPMDAAGPMLPPLGLMDNMTEFAEDEMSAVKGMPGRACSGRHCKNAGKGVLWQAGIDRFGMCFASHGGTLKLNQPPPTKKISNVGTMHWGVGLEGIFIGKQRLPTTICVPGSRHSGRHTACAAVPDSGTTLMMGPPDLLAELVAGLCDNWSRCQQVVATVAGASSNSTDAESLALASPHVAPLIHLMKNRDVKVLQKFHAFHDLLAKCGSWMDEKGGLKELPPVALNVSGKPGENQLLELAPHTYVFEVHSNSSNHSIVEHDSSTTANVTNKTCRAAFGPLMWQTPENGPVWILGLPLFYSYSVGYELTDKALSFTETTKQSPCNVCAGPGGPTSLVAEDEDDNGPRWHLSGPPRLPTYDTSQPF